MTQLTLAQAHEWVEKVLSHCGAHPGMAAATARALVQAEAQGIASHGLSRVPQYATHLKNGRADGQAVAQVARRKGAALLVDAAFVAPRLLTATDSP
jgi:(2R)-3-sulfolactate dehydrogenase (NADP+)